MIGDNILDTFFETFMVEKVFDEFIVELIIAENETLENLGDKENWNKDDYLDDYLIASMQFMKFVLEARGKFLEKHLHLIL